MEQKVLRKVGFRIPWLSAIALSREPLVGINASGVVAQKMKGLRCSD